MFWQKGAPGYDGKVELPPLYFFLEKWLIFKMGDMGLSMVFQVS